MNANSIFKTRVVICFIFLLSFPCAAQINPASSFQAGPVATLPAASDPSDLALADLDGDFLTDVAVTLRNLNAVQVYRQTTTGFTLPPVTYPTGNAPSAVEAIALDQANGQAVNDLLVLSGPSGALTSLLNDNNAQGTLSALPVTNIGSNNRAVAPFLATGYFDADAFADVVFSYDSPVRGGVWALKNTGFNTFTNPLLAPVTVLTNGAPGRLSTRDMDGDGTLDVLAPMPSSNEVRIFYNSGTRQNWWSNANQRDIPTLGRGPVSVAAADINNDSRQDLVIANATSQSLTWLLNTSPAQYGSAVTLALAAAPRQVLSADLNQDGAPDLLVLNANNTLSVYRNTYLGGPDRFDAPVVLATGADPVAMRVADLDQNGSLDVAVLCAGDNTVRTYLQTSSALSTRSTAAVEWQLYPNPTRQEVTLHAAEGGDLVVRDAMGRMVLHQAVGLNSTLAVGHLPRGVYAVQFISKRGSATHRLVLE